MATVSARPTTVAPFPLRADVQFPFLDLKAQFASIRDEVLGAMARVMESQHFILGPEVDSLEQEIAGYVGTSFAVACASGSDALLLAQMALDIQPGDEVITTPFTFGATAGSIARLGARPVFVDVDPETCNIDPDRIAAAISPRTRAIMPVHLFGLAADMDPIIDLARQRDLPVIEDAAQAIGAWYGGKAVGSIGTFGCFSFFPSKNLGCAGDGGIITTNDYELASCLRLLRAHGASKKYYYEILGLNSRLDALQAAILRVKLKRLDDWSDARRRNAAQYRELFEELELTSVAKLPAEPPGHYHVYNQFVIQVPDRARLRAHLQTCGIPTEIYYPAPLHLQPAFAALGCKAGDFPVSERLSTEVVALPIYPELSQQQQRAVAEAIAEFYLHS